MGTFAGDCGGMAVGIDADYATVGGLLLAPQLVEGVAGWLRPDDFARPLCGEIYALITTMRAESRPVDTVTVFGELRRLGRVRADGYPGGELIAMVESVPVAGMTRYYARQVLEAAVFRRVEQAGTRIIQVGRGRRGGPGDAFDAVGGCWGDLAEVRDRWRDCVRSGRPAVVGTELSREREDRRAGRTL